MGSIIILGGGVGMAKNGRQFCSDFFIGSSGANLNFLCFLVVDTIVESGCYCEMSIQCSFHENVIFIDNSSLLS